MNYTIKSPETESEWESYFNFRWEKLRKPLGMPKDSLKDDKEQDSCHLIAVDSDEEVVGTGRLHFNSKQEGQIRYMAVNESIQRKGLGSSIVLELEMMAKKKGAKKMVLNARENALNFYLSLGYKEIEPYESDTGIPHTTMSKELI
ncbi:MAG: GNAT family N-acetyltransferase [SAR86 cluster bacterium]|nr:GNAT family N-acetyltransferase [SAR86 cluster bacterium]